VTSSDGFDQIGTSPTVDGAGVVDGLPPHDPPSSAYHVLELVGSYEHGAFVPDRHLDEG
jgi:hypothetical protein